MLRVVAHKSAAAAKQYYTDGLKREDYYTKGQEVPGLWHGKAAALLGLSGKVEREAFLSLCGEKKTQERIAFTLKSGKPLRN